MKIKYFYDAQTERVIKHLIRLFSEFQVVAGYTEDGTQKMRTVPCRYAGYSKTALYAMMQNSTNMMNVAPIITLSISKLSIERQSMRAPYNENYVTGTNTPIQSDTGTKFEDRLDEQYAVDRYNPVPWTLEFNANLWTTNHTNKFEVLEQIGMLFNPSVVLQTSTNPSDWTSNMTVELMNCDWSSMGTPSTEEDIDVCTLSFKTTIWYALPARVTKPKLIQQIVSNIQTAKEEQDLYLHMSTQMDDIQDVYTPRNMNVITKRMETVNNTETYELTLVGSYGEGTDRIYSWDKLLSYFDPHYGNKILTIRFMPAIESTTYLPLRVTQIGSGDTANKLMGVVDTTSYNPQYGIEKFIDDDSQLYTSEYKVGDMFTNIGARSFSVGNFVVPAYAIIRKTVDGYQLVEQPTTGMIIYCTTDGNYYRWLEELGWHRVVMSKYRPGYWRIGLKEE